MRNKFILEILNEDETIKSIKEFKTLREIALEIDLEYFQVRELYKDSTKPKKYYHHHTLAYVKKFRVKSI